VAVKPRLLGAALLLCGAFSVAAAQDPSRDYLTISTPRFRVSFTKPLESVARRVAANAERAYTQLSADLHPPRGTIEILVTDDFDFSNGSAITYPTNRIIVYAMPPVNDFGLRYTTDWAQMVVTHELAHIFHLDRVRGHWRLLQYVFGRSPFLFPNSYQPSWLIEGLAVYEESRHAGQGRLEGPEHHLLLRAAALDRHFPRVGDASLARPTFPQGTSAYGYGSLFMGYIARTRGDSAIRKLVESSSVQLVPYLVDLPARSAFGTTFRAAWSEWQRSIEDALRDSLARPPVPQWRELTGNQLAAAYPRWTSSGSITYTATSGREVLTAYEVDSSGKRSNLGVRQGLSPTVKLMSGERLFAQYEYISPFEYRSDLYLQRDGSSPRRITRGERLFSPDARDTSDIIAMQVVEGATRIVRVAPDGRVSPLTSASLDTLYSEPRWSRAGDRIVASRWIRGGVAQIVLLDGQGRNPQVIASARQVMATPSWAPGDSGITFSNGIDLWRIDLLSRRTSRISSASAGIFEPEFGSTNQIAAITLHSDGYRLGVGSPHASVATPFSDSTADRRLPSLTTDESPSRKYSAVRQLLPRYWVPLAEEGFDGAWMFGGYTEGWDILRRHYWYAEARFPTDNSGINWAFRHDYRGLGRPIISTAVNRGWTPLPVFNNDTPPQRAGTLRRVITDGDITSTFVRQRARSTMSLSIGAGLERREYVGDPPSILPAVNTDGRFRTAHFPRVSASASYAKYYVPPFAISPEDGFNFVVTARERLKSAFNGTGAASSSVVSSLSLFKSLDLPGYAHHVVALRGAAGWADARASGYFDVGGVSGGTYQLFPGYTVGEGRRAFPVRGFAPGTALGIRAGSASLEYRAPLWLTHHALSTLPTFLQRSAITVFTDYGAAWCPSTVPTAQVCTNAAEETKQTFGSVGGELSVNAGILSWDVPTRLRFGAAVPVHNGKALGANGITVYFATGISF
jgi:hypothetical protein